ncbi:tail fiber domain-containing protein [Klebsiella pneumoniae]|nr:tail fiber domain-containing protein [Klebsiella pneumoniae]
MSPWLGGAKPAVSDRRLKKDISLLGVRPDGLGVYSFQYVDESGPFIGVMADEVERVYPDAVIDLGGYKAVDYSALEAA